jgi:signal peptidase I
VADRPDRLSGPPAGRTGGRAGTGIATGLGLLAVAFAAGVLPVGPVVVESGSMAPTLRDGDHVLLDHGSSDVRRGDVVALDDPAGSGLLVKRVVAVGGDRVAIEDGVLVVGGRPVAEPGIDRSRIDGVYVGPLTVPAGRIWVLGDDRGDSVDSRQFGPVPLDSVQGRVVGRVWPDPGPLPPRP